MSAFSLMLFSKKISRNAENSVEPVFIVGSGRSGNTLLRKLLIDRFDLFIPPETYVLGQVTRNFRMSRNLNWHDFVPMICAQFEYHPEFYHFATHSLRDFVGNARRFKPKDQNLETLIERLYLKFAEDEGQKSSRWGDKTPYNVYGLDQILKTFPKGYYIYLIRDGVDVAVSYKKAGLYATYQEAAHRWLESNNLVRLQAQRFPKQFLTVHYENLVRNPEATILEIQNFSNLSPISKKQIEMTDVKTLKHLERANKPVDQTSIGRGRMALTENDRKQLAPIMDKALLSFGYRPV